MAKVLLVEDDLSFRLLLRDNLSARFHSLSIKEARDGQEALDKTDAFHPDLIFMDIKLPGENGLQVTRKIKSKYPEITVIILTNYNVPEYRKAAYQFGADDFITKDASFEEIARLVEALLSEANPDRGSDTR